MQAIVKQVIVETPRVMSVVVALSQPISFRTGQAMRWNDSKTGHGRLFSIASPGGKKVRELLFTMRIFPEGSISSQIPMLQVGDVLDLVGPYGKFFFDDTDTRDLALIAGGSGISVLRSIIRHVVDNNLPHQLTLLFSVRNPHEIIYRDELEALSHTHPNFRHVVTVTNDSTGWSGRKGVIDEEIFEELFSGFGHMFYVCGPPGFITRAEEILKSRGVEGARIRVDRWVFKDYTS